MEVKLTHLLDGGVESSELEIEEVDDQGLLLTVTDHYGEKTRTVVKPQDLYDVAEMFRTRASNRKYDEEQRLRDELYTLQDKLDNQTRV